MTGCCYQWDVEGAEGRVDDVAGVLRQRTDVTDGSSRLAPAEQRRTADDDRQ